MRTVAACVVLSSILDVAVASPVQGQVPDTVLLNGKIVTVDAQFSTREGLSFGRIPLLATLQL